MSPVGRCTEITVVHAQACHFCEDASKILEELALEFPLHIERIGADEPRGRELVAEHRVPMYPLVLVGGAFFSFGRLPRRKLRKLLATRPRKGAVA
jgi:hypothetical protein